MQGAKQGRGAAHHPSVESGAEKRSPRRSPHNHCKHTFITRWALAIIAVGCGRGSIAAEKFEAQVRSALHEGCPRGEEL